MSHNVQECICVGCENIRKDAKRAKTLEAALCEAKALLAREEPFARAEGRKSWVADVGGFMTSSSEGVEPRNANDI